ncbi:pyrimidine utilization protein A [Palleronia sp. LCG004]|uniref:pyrimidine utilization protein A n=1 Tax=Palleronia sp. LCG004 TaxID=3079304 RepID=UPI002941DBAA|nr:pyrimidine utilization protein A [Palleronia sp. LCG004]WOI58023.1 pyrimidine utilization protein A [Palleronia sp. LCG004]
MEMGVFIPIGNNGWLISETAPQYMPSFDLNRKVVQKAEGYGLEFALSMIKLRGFGGKTEFWDHNLESFTLMAGLAAVTSRIKLFASTAILTLPPALVARMVATMDSIAPGRCGVNIVTGWAKNEYTQMDVWPGDEYFGYRYQYANEYVQVMRELWETGSSDFKGEHFSMEDCKLSPRPTAAKVVAAGQSAKGLKFAAEQADYNFVMGIGINTPMAVAEGVGNLMSAAQEAGRDVGAYVLFMIIADDTDEKAMARWEELRSGVDADALAWMADQGSKDTTADDTSTARHINLPEGAVNFNMGTLVGSHESVARMLEEVAGIDGVKGIMMTFDDFLVGLDTFGQKIQPLMTCRQGALTAAA